MGQYFIEYLYDDVRIDDYNLTLHECKLISNLNQFLCRDEKSSSKTSRDLSDMEEGKLLDPKDEHDKTINGNGRSKSHGIWCPPTKQRNKKGVIRKRNGGNSR